VVFVPYYPSDTDEDLVARTTAKFRELKFPQEQLEYIAADFCRRIKESKNSWALYADIAQQQGPPWEH
jgi:hypothetical protein